MTPKQIIITEEEARIIIEELMHAFVSQDKQKAVYNLIVRLEKELEVG